LLSILSPTAIPFPYLDLLPCCTPPRIILQPTDASHRIASGIYYSHPTPRKTTMDPLQRTKSHDQPGNKRSMSHGRGGAGNMNAAGPNDVDPNDLQTPTIKSQNYTTGRGGAQPFSSLATMRQRSYRSLY
jgi:hypothetical protein